jgi:hypothetical protein
MDEAKDAYGVDDFCARHGISRAYLYLLWQRGDGPRCMQVGSRRLISREAAADWRARMETAAVTGRVGRRSVAASLVQKVA